MVDESGKMDFELKDSEEKNVQQILGVCTKKESNELNCTLKVPEIHETEGVKIGELAKQSTTRGYCQSWHGLFTNKKSLGILQYHEPSIVYGKIIVKPPAEAVEGINRWKPSLVGQFLDKPSPFFVVKHSVENLWSQHGKVEVSSMENGLFIFRFADERTRNEFLEAKFWHIANKP